jgi:TonB family protein
MSLLKSITCLSIWFLVFLVCSCIRDHWASNRSQSDDTGALSRSELKPTVAGTSQGVILLKEQSIKDPEDPSQTTPCEAFWLSSVVFIGKVEEIEPNIQEGTSSRNIAAAVVSKEQDFEKVHLSVERTYRGNPGSNTVVQAPVKDAGSLEFKVGEKYLVYASTRLTDKNPSLIEVGSRTRLLAKAKEDLEFIERTPKPDSTIVDVTDGLHAISMDRPLYPNKAKKAGITGKVFVRIVVDETGKVIKAHGVCGPRALIPAAEKAARTWKYLPTLMSGKPVKVNELVVFRFAL